MDALEQRLALLESENRSFRLVIQGLMFNGSQPSTRAASVDDEREREFRHALLERTEVTETQEETKQEDERPTGGLIASKGPVAPPPKKDRRFLMAILGPPLILMLLTFFSIFIILLRDRISTMSITVHSVLSNYMSL